MKAKAQGQLRHRFWGEYSAVIALQFEDEYASGKAISLLGDGWQIGEKNKNVLVWVGDSEALETATEILGKFGADTKKIASIAKSIDYGEPFSIEVEIENENQLSLGIG